MNANLVTFGDNNLFFFLPVQQKKKTYNKFALKYSFDGNFSSFLQLHVGTSDIDTLLQLVFFDRRIPE